MGSVSLDIHKIISKFSYTYDDVGNRVSEVRKHLPAGKAGMSEDRNFTYNYDSVYQLIGVSGDQAPYRTEGSFTGQGQTQYDYDPVGNRETVTQAEEITTYTSDSLNQYTDVGGVAYSYDLNGNLTNDGINTYEYDFENRLTNVTVIATPTVMSGEAIYKYDPFGRRIEKDADGVITRYVYAGDQIIAEYDSDNNLIAKYVYGVGIDEVLKMERDDQTYYYHADGLTSISEITDSSGNVVEKYTYDVYGTPTIKDKDDNLLSESAIGNRYMFTGREYDAETGLYYYRARYYSPTLGRFLQRDLYTWTPNDLRIINFHPDYEVTKVFISSSGLEGSNTEQVLNLLYSIPSLITQIGTSNPSLLHLYLYVGNNPINWLDPWGYGKKDPWWKLTPQRALRWGGRALQEAGLKGLGKALGWTGLALEEGGMGKITGIAVGGTLGAGAASFIPVPGASVAGAIVGGALGGWVGSFFDSPDAGYAY